MNQVKLIFLISVTAEDAWIHPFAIQCYLVDFDLLEPSSPSSSESSSSSSSSSELPTSTDDDNDDDSEMDASDESSGYASGRRME